MEEVIGGDRGTRRWGDGEMGRWGDGAMGRWGDGEMGRWGDRASHKECLEVLPFFLGGDV